MADMAKRLHYAGETRLVEIKQSAWEGSAAHPERDGAKSETGGATEMLVDGHNGHNRTMVVGGDAPATAVVKWSNQQDIKHHGIEMKLEQPNTRAEVHRGALAMAKHLRRWCCRPRGRKRRTSISQRRQATRVGWLGAQGLGDAVASFAEDRKALR